MTIVEPSALRTLAARPENAAMLLSEALVCDLILPWTDYGRPDLRERTLPRVRESGVKYVSLTLATDAESQLDLFEKIARERRYILSRPKSLKLIENADDIVSARNEGKLAVSFNLQGTNALAGNLNMVEPLYRLGIRQVLLAYNKKNLVGDGCHERTDCGLSQFGIELVHEMNRVGMIVDCSHTGYRTSMEILEVSAGPVIFSHSNPRSLWQHDRNIRDDQALACAKTGGLVGVVGVGIFMGHDDASTEALFRQIDYYAELIGPDHIGLGLDYVYDVEAMQQYMAGVRSPANGNYTNMTKFFQPEQLPELVDAMIGRGYSEKDIRCVLGESFFRVAKVVWR